MPHRAPRFCCVRTKDCVSVLANLEGRSDAGHGQIDDCFGVHRNLELIGLVVITERHFDSLCRKGPVLIVFSGIIFERGRSPDILLRILGVEDATSELRRILETTMQLVIGRPHVLRTSAGSWENPRRIRMYDLSEAHVTTVCRDVERLSLNVTAPLGRDPFVVIGLEFGVCSFGGDGLRDGVNSLLAIHRLGRSSYRSDTIKVSLSESNRGRAELVSDLRDIPRLQP